MQKADPKREMSDLFGNPFAWAQVWQWRIGRGDTAGAKCAVREVLYFHRIISAQYNVLLSNVNKPYLDGDVDTAAAAKGYADMEGKDLQIRKTQDGHLNVSYNDSGMRDNHILMTPEEVLAYAFKLSAKDVDGLFANLSSGDTESGKCDEVNSEETRNLPPTRR